MIFRTEFQNLDSPAAVGLSAFLSQCFFFAEILPVFNLQFISWQFAADAKDFQTETHWNHWNPLVTRIDMKCHEVPWSAHGHSAGRGLRSSHYASKWNSRTRWAAWGQRVRLRLDQTTSGRPSIQKKITEFNGVSALLMENIETTTSHCCNFLSVDASAACVHVSLWLEDLRGNVTRSVVCWQSLFQNLLL